MVIIGYFITEDFHFHEVLLSFVPISDAYIDKQLADIVFDVLKKHNLLYQVLGITTDNICQYNHGQIYNDGLLMRLEPGCKQWYYILTSN